jgi:hypothetical protein
MKLKISIILLIMATLLCNAQDETKKQSQIDAIEDQTFNPNGIKLFPNPSVENITLEFKDQISNLMLEIIDVRGRLMFSKASRNTTLEKINISTFPQGVYFIRVNSVPVEDFLKFVKK